MAKKPVEKIISYPVKSPELGNLLASGYGMTIKNALEIIEERKKNPAMIPYEKYEKALAMIEAWETAPVAVDTEPGWKRDREA